MMQQFKINQGFVRDGCYCVITGYNKVGYRLARIRIDKFGDFEVHYFDWCNIGEKALSQCEQVDIEALRKKTKEKCRSLEYISTTKLTKEEAEKDEKDESFIIEQMKNWMENEEDYRGFFKLLHDIVYAINQYSGTSLKYMFWHDSGQFAVLDRRFVTWAKLKSEEVSKLVFSQENYNGFLRISEQELKHNRCHQYNYLI